VDRGKSACGGEVVSEHINPQAIALREIIAMINYHALADPMKLLVKIDEAAHRGLYGGANLNNKQMFEPDAGRQGHSPTSGG
jgi:hypothetical protein